MRHRVKGRKLGRDVQHRRALYKNLISSLIQNGRIKTTEAKAKAVRSKVDQLITQAKKKTLQSRRQIESYLNRSSLVNALVDGIAPKTGKRTSGYTRIIRLGRRTGDQAMMVKIEFVDNVISQETQKDQVKDTPKTTKPSSVKKSTAKKSTAKKAKTQTTKKTTKKEESKK